MENEEHLPQDSMVEKKPIVAARQRFAYDQANFQQKYQFAKPEDPGFAKTVSHGVQKKISKNCSNITNSWYWWKFLKNRFPVLQWSQHYSVRRNLLSDVIAGITVGVMHIPQGMAYAMLGNVPPVIGLYVSLFPVIIYVFMGTSRHISIGTFAVICLMLSKSVDRFATQPEKISSLTLLLTTNETLAESRNSTEIPLSESTYSPIEVAVVVGFTVGIIQLMMSILQMGSLSVYLSDTLISGFTTGAAVHVFTSQVKNIFGFTIPVRNGLFKIVHTYIDIISVITTANPTSMIVSFITIVILALVTELVNPRLKPKIKVPLPIELLVIISGTLVSHYLGLKPNYGVNVVGNIPTGLPYPKQPRFALLPDVFADSIAIAFVGFTITLSMAKLFSKKHKYDINANQELLAIGSSNIIASFLSCFPCCASLSRSLIQEGTGGKTQVAGLVSCIFLVVIILVVGPLFESLPNCILSSIIVVALKGMFKQFGDLTKIWKFSKLEALVWMVTFLGVVLTDVDVGLAIGLGATFVAVILRSQRPYACILGHVPGTEMYLDVTKYKTAKEEIGFKYFKFYSSLYYANGEFFLKELHRLTGINPNSIMSRNAELEVLKQLEHESMTSRPMIDTLSKDKINQCDIVCNINGPHIQSPQNYVDKLKCTDLSSDEDDKTIQIESVLNLLLDCSTWDFIDTTGITILNQVMKEYEEIGISVYLTCCPDTMLEMMQKHELFSKVFDKRTFPSISDAKAYISYDESVNKGIIGLPVDIDLRREL